MSANPNAVVKHENTRHPEAVTMVLRTIVSDDMKAKMRQALPQNVSIDRFTRVVLTAIQQNPAVAMVDDRGSLYNACVSAAKDGLLPDGREGALVVFRKKVDNKYVSGVQWMPMRAGLIKRLAQAGITIDAQIVRKNDEFSYELGDNPRITHKPNLLEERGEVIAVYAIATLANGTKMREILSVKDIERIQAASQTGGSEFGPWAVWWDEMARKSAIRRLYKSLPVLDAAINETVTRDDDLYEFGDTTVDGTAPAATDAPPAATGQKPAGNGRKRPSALNKIVGDETDQTSTGAQAGNGQPPAGEVIEGTGTVVQAQSAEGAQPGAQLF